MKEKIVDLLTKIVTSFGIKDIEISIEIPKVKTNGDYSSNVAMKLASTLKKSPVDIANEIIKDINEPYIEKVEIAGPGFINFYVKNDYLFDNINNIISLGDKYGSSEYGKGKSINVEFVSANPTGILHMGNARGGAYGDSLARIMRFSGYNVVEEYYMNDAGNQINKLGRSIYSKYLSLCGIDNEFPEDGYPGKEIDIIAKNIFDEKGNSLVDSSLEYFKKAGIEYLSGTIFSDLKEFRINYDVVTSEKSIYEKYPIENVLNKMKETGYLYEKEGATWFKCSSLLDSEDHVLVKSDGIYTYLVGDIPYHVDKYNRGFDKMIDVLGTDHHGYIPRLKSAIAAVGYNPDKLEVKLLQLVRLVKNGEVVTMHKRDGNIITLKNLVDEVGVNAARYYFSKYSLDTQMDFDIELAKKKSSDNPVYYVCYAYARICSILSKYENIKNVDSYNNITEESAYNVLSSIYKFPEVVKSACIKEMPHLITNYVYELASYFHTYYETCRIISDDEDKTLENLNIIKAVKITLFNALNLIGVVPEEKM